jgi:hypothetical protein
MYDHHKVTRFGRFSTSLHFDRTIIGYARTKLENVAWKSVSQQVLQSVQ